MNCSVSSANACKIRWEIREICGAYKLFQVNMEVDGMKTLFGCTPMAPVAAKSKLFALSTWISSAKDAKERSAHIEDFRDLTSSLKMDQLPDIFADFYGKVMQWNYLKCAGSFECSTD